MVIGQPAHSILWEPDGIGQSHDDGFGGMDERQSAKDGVAQADRTLLHGIGDVRGPDAAAKIFDDIGFAGRKNEADVADASAYHPLNEVFTDRARPLGLPVKTAADGQELFRECERLNTAAHASRGNDSPHFHTSFSLYVSCPTFPPPRHSRAY